jgi:acyl-CoA-binding protein
VSDFTLAMAKVQTLSIRPSNPELLELYALFKQGTEGDVKGARPGLMDIKGGYKYDAWASKKGMSAADAQAAYVALVKKLLARDGKAW